MMMRASDPFIKVDFHIHSQHSDGSLTPQALFALAVEQELDQISITDHDTVAAYADLAAHGPGHNKGIKIIPGCEFSCLWAGRNIHVLGLNLNLQHRGLIKAMAFQANARLDRAQTIAEVLAKFGFKDTLEGAQAKATGDIVGRPHFAQHLVDAGHVKNMRQAFQLYLGAGKPGDIKSSWPDLIQVCQWISEAGGVAVIAHPMKYGLTLTKLRKLCVEFKAAGGLGLEVISGSQDPVKTDTLAMLAANYDFFASAGSDFHQPGQTWAELGKVVSLPVRCTPIWQCWQ